LCGKSIFLIRLIVLDLSVLFHFDELTDPPTLGDVYLCLECVTASMNLLRTPEIKCHANTLDLDRCRNQTLALWTLSVNLAYNHSEVSPISGVRFSLPEFG